MEDVEKREEALLLRIELALPTDEKLELLAPEEYEEGTEAALTLRLLVELADVLQELMGQSGDVPSHMTIEQTPTGPLQIRVLVGI